MKDQKFMLFGGQYYYPRGGISDFLGFFETLDEAVEYARNKGKEDSPYWEPLEWAHIVNMKTHVIHRYRQGDNRNEPLEAAYGYKYEDEVGEIFKPAQSKDFEND